jgi:Tol biopolymer transport system component/CubicO group peptidase (beta-lactamase class C family)
MSVRHRALALVLLVALLAAGCGSVAPVATSVPATATEIAVIATNTLLPPTATPAPPTATAAPPTPTQTPLPPTATPLPTDTPLPPTSTPQPTSTPFLPLSGSGGGVIAFVSSGDIYLMNADGSDQRNLTNHPASDDHPCWSPDGSLIAFSSDRSGNYEIYVMAVSGGTDSDGANLQRLTRNPAVDGHPTWSPDGRRIAFVSLRDGNAEIYVMAVPDGTDADGSDLQRLTVNQSGDHEPDWSPDGTQIVFASSAGIYVMSSDGSGRQKLTGTDADDFYPRWSPDGTQIAYLSRRDGSLEEIYVMNSDGTNQRRLTNNDAFDGAPSWSPDGTQVVFASDRDGDHEIYVMDAGGAEQGSDNVRRLTDNNVADRKPAWRPSMVTSDPADAGDSCQCPSLDPLQTQLVYDVEPSHAAGFWSLSTPEEEGMDSDRLEAGVAALAEFSNLYSVLIVRNDKIVLERYFRGEGPRHAHDIASASKSFLSALVGIAIHEGYVQSIDQTAAEFLPTYFASAQDPRKLDITLRYLLTMTPGFSYKDTLYDLEGDWLATAISYPLASEPGSSFNYSTMSSHILSAILTKATGMSTCEFACRYLFQPIGITVDNWSRDPQGYYMGGVAMYFTPRELAKFGLLYLHNGAWDGRQVVPAEWIAESMTPQIAETGFPGVSYGFFWWLESAGGYEVYAAVGHGGQTIRIVPDLNLVVITTADLYAPAQNIETFPLIEEYVIPSIQDAASP